MRAMRDGPRVPILVSAPPSVTIDRLCADMSDHGYVIERADNIAQRIAVARGAAFGLVIVDCLEVGPDQIRTIRALCDEWSGAAILALTAGDHTMAAIEAIESGADDSICRECPAAEIIMRVDALLGRSGGRPAIHPIA